MRIFKIVIIGLLLLLVPVLYIFLTTGFFRTIENYSDLAVQETMFLPGSEDMAISRSDSFLIISATDRKFYDPTDGFVNGLYLVDLKQSEWKPVLLSSSFQGEFNPHGISMIQTGETYQIVAINHTSEYHSVEVFTFDGSVLSHEETITDPALVSPNDLVLTAPDKFYITNDHGYTKGFMRLLEDYGGIAFSNVLYYDGDSFTEAAENIAYANGINYDQDRALLYVASPRSFTIKVYHETSAGSIDFMGNIKCGTGADNIELDESGVLYTAGHPNLLKFTSYATGKSEYAPSEVLKITYSDKDDYKLERLYLDSGEKLSASSVACKYGEFIFVGTVMDDEVLILQSKGN
ncbi:hypothetical protein [Fulvivirga sedimenti]|uniref:Arylesterase n=1 Tax=Fulvivirga sedimenti TaxID=2879465 RepID=A0A9X1HR58_9BACT|nr:hypothetical protein [Fulvivirga sedimenti]MCA6074489.1 hypothetical protein [Fulvivirga sedimenti]MCA6075666.1 hypothetical protein [Fulvivirga sedimenti]MCA6076794.1 hypothetical protein [Fulvivirga sedimenti]